LRVYNETTRKNRSLAYYRTASGVEIDFIIESRKRSANAPAHLVAIEVKRADKWNRSWESGLKDLANQTGLKVDRLIAVYAGTRPYHFASLDVLPVSEFLQDLHHGEIF
jgi:predicted AAA+ superfamily ATPase